MSGVRRWLFDRGGLLALLAFGVYTWVASPFIVGNDNAEFSTLGDVGGIAHPSGYPGYVLWLRAMSWLPGESAAHTAALATVVLAAIQLLVLHAAARVWGAKPIAATLAVAIYAAGPLVLRYSTEAEAFAPNQLVVALVLWLAPEHGPLKGCRRALALGLVAGLGMTNHLTCTLVVPVGVWGVVHAVREGKGLRALPVVLAVAGWIIGMSPYLYLLIAPDNLLSWPAPTTFSDFLDIVLRRTYGGAFGFSGSGDPVPYGDQLIELFKMMGRGWLWLGMPIGLGVFAMRIARPVGESRGGWIALAFSWLIAGPLLVTRFDVPVVEFGVHVVHRFHLLPILLLVIPVAVGLTLLADKVPARPVVLQVVVHVCFVAAIASSLVDVARYRTPAMELSARNTLRSMPKNAVIMAAIVDELDVGIRYLQLTRNERLDVLFFRWPDAAVPWYAKKLGPYGLVVVPGVTFTVAHAIDRFHAAGRPVFVYWFEKELREIYPSYPFGILVRLLPRGEKPPSAEEVFTLNRELFNTFDLGYPLPGKTDQFATWVHRKYAGTWARIADDLMAVGKREEAATAIEYARALGPQRAPSL